MNDKALDILKSAILLEKKGHAFYKATSERTDCKELKEFFGHMANEEVVHCEILTKQYKNVVDTGNFSSDFIPSGATHEVVSTVLTNKIKEQISAASYEAAAISAAMSMEKAATTLYRERMNATSDPEEKALYKWLSDFEDGHLEDLVNIDQQLQEQIWYDNSFWPS
ncbi:MAG: ferritin family protein [Bacteriovoracaceae bacterium]|nr:ferritin family protein [Bacteriovoracaceae bacterium]